MMFHNKGAENIEHGRLSSSSQLWNKNASWPTWPSWAFRLGQKWESLLLFLVEEKLINDIGSTSGQKTLAYRVESSKAESIFWEKKKNLQARPKATLNRGRVWDFSSVSISYFGGSTVMWRSKTHIAVIIRRKPKSLPKLPFAHNGRGEATQQQSPPTRCRKQFLQELTNCYKPTHPHELQLRVVFGAITSNSCAIRFPQKRCKNCDSALVLVGATQPTTGHICRGKEEGKKKKRTGKGGRNWEESCWTGRYYLNFLCEMCKDLAAEKEEEEEEESVACDVKLCKNNSAQCKRKKTWTTFVLLAFCLWAQNVVSSHCRTFSHTWSIFRVIWLHLDPFSW